MILHFVVLIVVLSSGNGQPIVDTTYGRVQGLTRQYPRGTVLQFKRIPFATPPVGDYRFEKPIAHPPWNEILNATEFGPSCMQEFFQNDIWLLENKEMSEDCLHLNIFVPGSIDKANPKAIMIWVHGGGYTGGQGTLFDGSYLALQGEVIVVTINYRLGLFGFLSTEDGVVRGNYGLWDQKKAIEWIHENAMNFGGDRNRITIFGESAGGDSVGLQSMISSNKGFFNRVISESGGAYSPKALASGSRKVAFKAGSLLHCPLNNNNSAILLQCLKSKSAKELLQVQNDAASGLDQEEVFTLPIGPVVDGELILGNPVDLLDDKRSASFQFFQSLDIMAGTNNAEGGLIYWYMMGYQNQYNFNISEGIPVEVLCHELAPIASESYFSSSRWVTQEICKQFTVKGGNLAEQARSTVNVFADLAFIVPTIQSLLVHAGQQSSHSQNTYHYLFSHQPKFSWIQDRPRWLHGANHAGELPFVFGLYAMYPNTSAKDGDELELSKQMMTYWSNFAKTGNPNVGSQYVLPTWPNFEVTRRTYMNLTTNPTAESHLYQDRMRFWTETAPALLKLQNLHIPIVIFGK